MSGKLNLTDERRAELAAEIKRDTGLPAEEVMKRAPLRCDSLDNFLVLRGGSATRKLFLTLSLRLVSLDSAVRGDQ